MWTAYRDCSSSCLFSSATTFLGGAGRELSIRIEDFQQPVYLFSISHEGFHPPMQAGFAIFCQSILPFGWTGVGKLPSGGDQSFLFH
jgi:hypothetical protein